MDFQYPVKTAHFVYTPFCFDFLSCGTICAQLTWPNVECVIARINCDRQFSLKEAGTWRITVRQKIILKEFNLSSSSEEL